MLLVVFCPQVRVAERYRRLVEGDRYSVPLRPYILTPANVPLVLDAERARADLPLAAISLVCHGGDGAVDAAFAALYEATRTVDLEQARRICDMALAGVPEAVRARLEAHITVIDSKYRSDLFRGAEAAGMAAAKSEDLLAVVESRGIDVPEAVRAEVLGCADLDRLDTWFHRALTATCIDDVFSK